MPADIELEVSFGATRGLANYSSERADERIRITVHSENDTLPEWLNDITAAETMLRNQCIFQVAESLRLDAAMNEGGDAELIWPEPQPAPAQLAAPAPAPSGGDQQGTGGAGQKPPKATREEYAALPRYAMNIGNRGMKQYVDQRPLKAIGKYSQKAPDFKEDISNGDGFWILDQNGNVVMEVQQAMTASGVQ